MRVRLLPFASAGGAANMAADEALLQSAGQGSASLRFYGWSVPTVSLGYFQPAALRHRDALLGGLPFVRRPSGGAMLVHHQEITYALALPADLATGAGPAWLLRMHQIIAAALAELGVTVAAHVPRGEAHRPGFLCFRHFAAGDLLIGPAKVVGSAQRRQRGALLQHGAVLLARSPHTPLLPGIRELTGRLLAGPDVCQAIRQDFERQTGWQVTEGPWTEAERQASAELVAAKYGPTAWNDRR